MRRKAEKQLRRFFKERKRKALLITGARQVGKTWLVRHVTEDLKLPMIEINLVESPEAMDLFSKPGNAQELLFRISSLAKVPMEKGKTIIFIDEVQVCPEIVTAIKFLVDEGSYQYVLSGSLLGVELEDIRSVPVGYMDVLELFPLDFEEFAAANGVSDDVLERVREAFHSRQAMDDFVHSQLMKLFELYLIVGGMPAVTQTYLDTNDVRQVIREQQSIIAAYKRDISKYDPDNKLYIEEIFDLIPSELNAKNKRFILKNLNENSKFSRMQNSFVWLKDAGVALPTFCASDAKVPLMLSRTTSLFKLFLSDVGLLAAMYMNGIQIRILSGETSINYGSVYENVAAQELRAHGFDLYYYNSKKNGEVDFLIELNGHVLPIEIKSGKDYTRHVALNNLLSAKDDSIREALVFSNENLKISGKVTYCPIYMIGCIEKDPLPDTMIWKADLTGLR